MELWVRSQDRSKLKRVNNLYIVNDNTIYDEITLLGTYKTKERALEVLGDIQETLIMCIKSNGNEHLVGTSCYVYIMPQE